MPPLIKMSQAGRVPIIATRPYGCFPRQRILADLYTSRWRLRLWCWSQTEAVSGKASADCWPSHQHTPFAGVSSDHRKLLPCFAVCFCFTLTHVPTLSWNTGRPLTLPSSVLHKLQWVNVLHHLGPSHFQSCTVIPTPHVKTKRSCCGQSSHCCLLLTFEPLLREHKMSVL